MDDLDVRIVKELSNPGSPQWNVRETYSGIAKRLGVDEETVRRRLKRAQELGTVTGWKMMVNPHLLGCKAACLDLEVGNEEKKDSMVAEIRQVDGVIKILNFRGKGLQITLYYESDDALKEITRLIQSKSSSSNPVAWELHFPRPEIILNKTDWKIVDAMLDDARQSLEEVSRSTGISVRTVERRLTTMSEERTVYLQGTPHFKNFMGVSCVFLVFCPAGGEKKRIVDESILAKVARIELANTTGDQYSTFAMIFDNLTQADDFVGWIEGLDGVQSAKMGIMNELIVVQEWLRRKVRERV